MLVECVMIMKITVKQKLQIQPMLKISEEDSNLKLLQNLLENKKKESIPMLMDISEELRYFYRIKKTTEQVYFKMKQRSAKQNYL